MPFQPEFIEVDAELLVDDDGLLLISDRPVWVSPIDITSDRGNSMIPSVTVTQIYTAVSALSLAGGYVPIVGPANDGPTGVPTPCSSTDQAISIFKGGPLVEFACWYIKVKKLPLILVRASATEESAFSTVSRTVGHGTSAVTVHTGSDTSISSAVQVLISTGGTVGTSWSYRLSTNGGLTFGAPINVTTAAFINITLGTGTLRLDFATGNLVTNEVIGVFANIIAAGTYATIDTTSYPLGTNTAVASADAATFPDNDYEISLMFDIGGSLGTDGPVYRYSLRSGADPLNPSQWSNQLALGTALNVVIPGTGGVSIILGTAAQTIGNGAVIKLRTYAPNFNTQSVTDALAALFLSKLTNWRRAVLCGTVDHSMAQTIDAIFASNFANTTGGKKAWIANARLPQLNEDDVTYFTAMGVAFPTRDLFFGSICYGDSKIINAVLQGGPLQKRPVALIVGAELATVDPSVDIARVDRPGLACQLADDNGNPDCHDENVMPGPDDLGFITMIQQPEGVFVTNPRIFGPKGTGGGVDPMTVHRDIANIHADVAVNTLRKVLSTSLKANVKTGTILEADAQRIEGVVNQVENDTLKGMISGQRVEVSRTDVLTGTNPPTMTVTGEVVSLIYPKKINFTEQLVVKLSSANG